MESGKRIDSGRDIQALMTDLKLKTGWHEGFVEPAKLDYQVHCVNAFGRLAEIVQREGPFPSGLILHSWGGNAELVKQLRRTEGVYFSISGHICSLAEKKIQHILQQVSCTCPIHCVQMPTASITSCRNDGTLEPAASQACVMLRFTLFEDGSKIKSMAIDSLGKVAAGDRRTRWLTLSAWGSADD